MASLSPTPPSHTDPNGQIARAAALAAEFVAPLASAPPDAETETVSVEADSLNPGGREFPGGRGADQLVVYDPGFGPRTGTNPWGNEAVVRDGIVTHVGGNDSVIPRDGFVLSGHGRGKDWMLKHLLPGDEVSVTNRTVERRRTLRSHLWYGAYLTALARQGAKPDADALAQVDAALAAAREALLQRSDDDAGVPSNASAAVRAQVVAALRAAERAYYGAHASRTPEARGVWVRLTPHGPASPERLVETLAAARMNLVLPETIYYGRTIYPAAPGSPLGQWKEFQGTDPLARLIEASHRRGIQVHAWCHIFFIGFEDSPLIALHPDWLAQDRAGRTASIHEPGYYYVQPSNPEARKFLMTALEDLVRRYDLDGLQLDYIRYPNVPVDAEGYDYSEATRRRFKSTAGTDPMALSPTETPEKWREWEGFREASVSSFVKDSRERLRKIRPGLQISAAVFPDLDEARGHKSQDWKAWVDAGWLDFVAPMAYFTDAPPVRDATRDMKALIASRIPIYTGVGPYMGLLPPMVIEQVEASREGGADGVIFFSHNEMNDQQYGALGAGVFRDPAAIGRRDTPRR